MRDYREAMRAARAETEGDAAQFARVSAAARRRRVPVAVYAGAAIALAAAALFALRPVRVDRSLDDAGAVALGGDVHVEAQGAGAVTGDTKAMVVRWTDGRLDVEVEPDQGVALRVETPDGAVTVVGTGFAVTRDALGTSVSVRHGKVAVHCARGTDTTLEAGGETVCAPATAAGTLGRVVALRGTLAPESLVQEVDAGLAMPDAVGATAAELRVLRATALLDAGRDDDAYAEVERALALPDVTRAVELHRLAARLRLRVDDCAGALPHLRALAAADALGEDAPALVRCGG